MLEDQILRESQILVGEGGFEHDEDMGILVLTAGGDDWPWVDRTIRGVQNGADTVEDRRGPRVASYS
jgi:hypothetical protein